MRPIILLAITVPHLVGCGTGSPFDYVPANGKITYEDGSLIPAKGMILNFTSLSPPIDKKTIPRVADTRVNVADGTFDSVTSYKPGDGLVPGKHKVELSVSNAHGKPTDLVPAEYLDINTSPLIVDTADIPLHLKIPKP